jgi:hypothetical protein
MPLFAVRLHGHGIDVPMDDASAGGFFTSRLVRASDAASAKLIAAQRLEAEWNNGPHFKLNRSGVLSVDAESAVRVGIVRALFHRRQGYVFYPLGS